MQGNTQNYDQAIRQMFAQKDDVDYTLKSESNGSQSSCAYYVANDSLYEDNMRIIALKDIDFSTIDYYRNVFNTIDGNYPYVLAIHPKANAFSYFYGYQSSGEIDLYLPNQSFAEQTFSFLENMSHGGSTAINTTTQNEKQPGPQEICNSTYSFLNDLVNTNFSGYMGALISSSDLGFRNYTSTISFPLAVSTSIIDTNMFQQYYRGAEILMMEESQFSQDVSAGMQHNYEQLCGILKICLEANGFTYTNKDNDPYAIYKLQTEYTQYLPNDPNNLFADLQTKRGLIVNVRVDQSSTGNGVYTNQLFIYLKEQ